MAPDTLLHLIQLILGEKPRLVVELGSGASTLWAAHALRGVPDARLVSFDHDERYLTVTEGYLRDHGLEVNVDLRWAPLVDVSIAGKTRRWYSPDRMTDLEGIDFLIVDGPPKSTGDLARLPAVPQLIDHFSDEALILVDDMHRKDERAIVDGWLSTYPDMEVLHGPGLFGRHAVLHFRRGSGMA
jgi:predicted O-methyltransferase YrrM